MKTPEDEAFDDLARKQGMWGGGFQSKRQAAMDKVNSHFDAEYKKMHEDRAMYGTSWSKDGERIDPASVYKEPAQEPVAWMYDWLCDGKLITGWIAHNEAEIPKLVASNIRPLYTTPPAQEPVAWITPDGEGFRIRFSAPTNDVPLGWDALYTTPPAQEPDALTIAYQSGFYDGKKAALATREWNFCERCGKRTKDMFTIHTCTPPQGAA